MTLSQPTLIGDILKSIGRQYREAGVPEPGVLPRQMQAVIQAANDIIREFEEPRKEAQPGCGIGKWLSSDDTGLSSHQMVRKLARLAGISVSVLRDHDGPHYPHDPSDLWRCVKLLDCVPELRPHLPAMAGVCPEWARLVERWDELESLVREEYPSGLAPRTFDLMQEILKESK